MFSNFTSRTFLYFSILFDEGPKYLTQYEIYISINLVIQYGVPFLLLTYSYVRMGIRLWTNQTPGNADDRRDEG